MVSNEFANALNIVIMPLFWIVLAPTIFPNLSWHGYDLFIRVRMTCIHLFPFVSTTINLIVSDMELLSKDWTKVFFLGLTYMCFNAFGTWIFG